MNTKLMNTKLMDAKLKTMMIAGSAALASLVGMTALPTGAGAWQAALTPPVVVDTPQNPIYNRAVAGGHGVRGPSSRARVGGQATHGYGGRSYDLH